MKDEREMGLEEPAFTHPNNIMEPPSYQEAREFIRSSLVNMAKNFIAIGYALKYVRDRQLYESGGYGSVWEFAQEEYGFSKSTASRYMSMNDRFSEGGNSPAIQERYQGFNKSQLQEMLSLDEEQLERVTPADRVEDIRAMRKPREIPYVELPGQISISDFPGIEPEEAEAYEQQAAAEVQQGEAATKPYTVTLSQLVGEAETGEAVAISQQEGSGENSSGYPEKAVETAAVPLSAFGTPKRIYPPGSLLSTEGCEGGHDCFSCPMDCRIRGAEQYCREAPMGNPFPCEITMGGFSNLPDTCQFVDHDRAAHCVGNGEPDPCCKNCQEPCEYICGRAMKALDKETEIPETGQEDAAISQQEESDLGYWNPDEKGPDERWNLGDIPQAKEKHLKELAEVLIEQMRVQLLWDDRYGYLSDDVITEKMKMLSVKFNHEIPLENGVIAYGCEDIIEFARGEEDLGICSYKRFATQVRKLMENRNSDADDLMEDKEDEEELPHDSDERTVPELSDIDLLRNMLEKEKSTLEEMLKVNKVEPHPALEKIIRKKKLLVDALAGMLCDLEQPELPEKEDIPEQPELPVLKNNDQRKEWLNTFHDWPIWFEVPQAAEVYYRYDLPDGCSLVICEYHYWLEWMIHYGDDPERTGTREYLLAPGYHYLEDCKSNRTTMIEKLKEIQKK